MTSFNLFWGLYCGLWAYFIPFSNVLIVDFKFGKEYSNFHGKILHCNFLSITELQSSNLLGNVIWNTSAKNTYCDKTLIHIGLKISGKLYSLSILGLTSKIKRKKTQKRPQLKLLWPLCFYFSKFYTSFCAFPIYFEQAQYQPPFLLEDNVQSQILKWGGQNKNECMGGT